MANIVDMQQDSDGSCFITIKLDEIEAEQIFSNALKDFVLEEKSAEALAKLVMSQAQQEVEFEEPEPTPAPKRRRRKPRSRN